MNSRESKNWLRNYQRTVAKSALVDIDINSKFHGLNLLELAKIDQLNKKRKTANIKMCDYRLLKPMKHNIIG